MGIGHFRFDPAANAGGFDLIVSFEFVAGPGHKAGWQLAFRRLSQRLSDATVGQMKLNAVRFVSAKASPQGPILYGQHEADVRIKLAGTATTKYDALVKANAFFRVPHALRFEPLTLLHEFGHYAFNLGEEYSSTVNGAPGGAECTGNKASGACAMEFTDSFPGPPPDTQVYKFCLPTALGVPESHDPDGDTHQTILHPGKSCWETIVTDPAFKGVGIPGTGSVPAYPATFSPTFGPLLNVWEELDQTHRLCLLLDKSGSMTGVKMAAVSAGAHQWLNKAVGSFQGDESLSILAFDTAQPTLLPQTEVASAPAVAVNNAKAAIVALATMAGGNTDIGGALNAGSDEILVPAGRAITQVIVLVSDGIQTQGTDPSQVWDDVLHKGTRVFTLAIGPNADEPLLAAVAEATAGEARVAPPISFSIRNKLTEIHTQVASGIVATRAATLPDPGELPELPRLGYEGDLLAAAVELPLDEQVSPLGFDMVAEVEEGALRLNVAVNHEADTHLFVYLLDPHGELVDPFEVADHFVDESVDFGYVLYGIDYPEPGPWRVRVVRGDSSGPLPLKAFAWLRNGRLTTFVDHGRHRYEAGDVLTLRAAAWFPEPLTAMEPPVLELAMPEFGDDPAPGHELVAVFDEDPPDSGNYRAEYPLSEPGTFDFVVRFRNDGTARPVPMDPKEQEEAPVFPFVREKPFTVVVA